MRPFALLLFSALLLGCDPPDDGSSQGPDQNPSQNPDDNPNQNPPPSYTWAGDYIITNSTDANVEIPHFFQNGVYAAGELYLGTLHVGADKSVSIASIAKDFTTSGATYRIDFETPKQNPSAPPNNIPETTHNANSMELRDNVNVVLNENNTNIIPIKYERNRHWLTIGFSFFSTVPAINAILGISAGADPTESWTSGLSSSLPGITSQFVPFDVTLQRKP